MADNDGITTVQSFTERTLKYGRNMMAAAVPIILFALVPVVDLAQSRPLNFEITAGGEIWIWVVLLALLAYYGFRFFGLAIPDFLFWWKNHGSFLVSQKSLQIKQINDEKVRSDELAIERREFHDADNPPQTWRNKIAEIEHDVKNRQTAITDTRFKINDYKWRRTYFWLVDAGLPIAFFAVAAVSASIEIIALLPPPDTPPTP